MVRECVWDLDVWSVAHHEPDQKKITIEIRKYFFVHLIEFFKNIIQTLDVEEGGPAQMNTAPQLQEKVNKNWVCLFPIKT